MDMSEKNGQPSMEEILASIRRIIAEEPGDALHTGPLRTSGGSIAPESLDEAGEFELPSMFRGAGTPSSDKSTAAPLLGRLTDAIRSASQPGSGDSASAPPAQTDITLGANTAAAQPAVASGLSSLKPVRHDVPAAAPAWTQPAPEAAPAASAFAASFPLPPPASAPNLKREMVAFKDTRFSRMTNLGSRDATPSTPAAPATPPVAGFSAIAPAKMDRVGMPAAAPQVTPRATSMVPPPVVRAAQPQTDAQSAVQADQAAGGAIDDTTAELLRPMLRQWLSENMPRMVEKALHIEVAESVKTGSKTTKLQ